MIVITVSQQHATWLRHKQLRESGAKVESGIQFVGEKGSHIVKNDDSYKNCDPGYTGPTCSNRKFFKK